jgi:hypothetical protein
MRENFIKEETAHLVLRNKGNNERISLVENYFCYNVKYILVYIYRKA